MSRASRSAGSCVTAAATPSSASAAMGSRRPGIASSRWLSRQWIALGPLGAGNILLTQLRVGLGSASPTLTLPSPPIGGEGRVRGLSTRALAFVSIHTETKGAGYGSRLQRHRCGWPHPRAVRLMEQIHRPEVPRSGASPYRGWERQAPADHR